MGWSLLEWSDSGNLLLSGLHLESGTPTLSPSGTYTTAQTLSMSTATGGSSLRYTLDGTDTTEASPVYTSPVAVSPRSPSRRWRSRQAGTPAPSERGPLFNDGTLPTPTASLTATTHVGTQSVALAGAVGAELRYTLTGAEPTATSTLYAAPLDVPTSGTLKVQAYKPGYTASGLDPLAWTPSQR